MRHIWNALLAEVADHALDAASIFLERSSKSAVDAVQKAKPVVTDRILKPERDALDALAEVLED